MTAVVPRLQWLRCRAPGDSGAWCAGPGATPGQLLLERTCRAARMATDDRVARALLPVPGVHRVRDGEVH